MSDSQLESKPESEKTREQDQDFVAPRQVDTGERADRTHGASAANGQQQADSSQAGRRGLFQRFSNAMSYVSNAAQLEPVAPLHGSNAKHGLDVVLPSGLASQNPTVVANLLRGVIANGEYTTITQLAANDPTAAREQLTKQFASLTSQVAATGDAVALHWLAQAAQDPANAIKYYYAAAQRVQRLQGDMMQGLQQGAKTSQPVDGQGLTGAGHAAAGEGTAAVAAPVANVATDNGARATQGNAVALAQGPVLAAPPAMQITPHSASATSADPTTVGFAQLPQASEQPIAGGSVPLARYGGGAFGEDIDLTSDQPIVGARKAPRRAQIAVSATKVKRMRAAEPRVRASMKPQKPVRGNFDPAAGQQATVAGGSQKIAGAAKRGTARVSKLQGDAGASVASSLHRETANRSRISASVSTAASNHKKVTAGAAVDVSPVSPPQKLATDDVTVSPTSVTATSMAPRMAAMGIAASALTTGPTPDSPADIATATIVVPRPTLSLATSSVEPDLAAPRVVASMERQGQGLLRSLDAANDQDIAALSQSPAVDNANPAVAPARAKQAQRAQRNATRRGNAAKGKAVATSKHAAAHQQARQSTGRANAAVAKQQTLKAKETEAVAVDQQALETQAMMVATLERKKEAALAALGTNKADFRKVLEKQYNEQIPEIAKKIEAAKADVTAHWEMQKPKIDVAKNAAIATITQSCDAALVTARKTNERIQKEMKTNPEKAALTCVKLGEEDCKNYETQSKEFAEGIQKQADTSRDTEKAFADNQYQAAIAKAPAGDDAESKSKHQTVLATAEQIKQKRLADAGAKHAAAMVAKANKADEFAKLIADRKAAYTNTAKNIREHGAAYLGNMDAELTNQLEIIAKLKVSSIDEANKRAIADLAFIGKEVTAELDDMSKQFEDQKIDLRKKIEDALLVWDKNQKTLDTKQRADMIRTVNAELDSAIAQIRAAKLEDVANLEMEFNVANTKVDTALGKLSGDTMAAINAVSSWQRTTNASIDAKTARLKSLADNAIKTQENLAGTVTTGVGRMAANAYEQSMLTPAQKEQAKTNAATAKKARLASEERALGLQDQLSRLDAKDPAQKAKIDELKLKLAAEQEVSSKQQEIERTATDGQRSFMERDMLRAREADQTERDQEIVSREEYTAKRTAAQRRYKSVENPSGSRTLTAEEINNGPLKKFLDSNAGHLMDNPDALLVELLKQGFSKEEIAQLVDPNNKASEEFRRKINGGHLPGEKFTVHVDGIFYDDDIQVTAQRSSTDQLLSTLAKSSSQSEMVAKVMDFATDRWGGANKELFSEVTKQMSDADRVRVGAAFREKFGVTIEQRIDSAANLSRSNNEYLKAYWDGPEAVVAMTTKQAMHSGWTSDIADAGNSMPGWARVGLGVVTMGSSESIIRSADGMRDLGSGGTDAAITELTRVRDEQVGPPPTKDAPVWEQEAYKAKCQKFMDGVDSKMSAVYGTSVGQLFKERSGGESSYEYKAAAAAMQSDWSGFSRNKVRAAGETNLGDRTWIAQELKYRQSRGEMTEFLGDFGGRANYDKWVDSNISQTVDRDHYKLLAQPDLKPGEPGFAAQRMARAADTLVWAQYGGRTGFGDDHAAMEEVLKGMSKEDMELLRSKYGELVGQSGRVGFGDGILRNLADPFGLSQSSTGSLDTDIKISYGGQWSDITGGLIGDGADYHVLKYHLDKGKPASYADMQDFSQYMREFNTGGVRSLMGWQGDKADREWKRQLESWEQLKALGLENVKLDDPAAMARLSPEQRAALATYSKTAESAKMWAESANIQQRAIVDNVTWAVTTTVTAIGAIAATVVTGGVAGVIIAAVSAAATAAAGMIAKGALLGSKYGSDEFQKDVQQMAIDIVVQTLTAGVASTLGAGEKLAAGIAEGTIERSTMSAAEQMALKLFEMNQKSGGKLGAVFERFVNGGGEFLKVATDPETLKGSPTQVMNRMGKAAGQNVAAGVVTHALGEHSRMEMLVQYGLQFDPTLSVGDQLSSFAKAAVASESQRLAGKLGEHINHVVEINAAPQVFIPSEHMEGAAQRIRDEAAKLGDQAPTVTVEAGAAGSRRIIVEHPDGSIKVYSDNPTLGATTAENRRKQKAGDDGGGVEPVAAKPGHGGLIEPITVPKDRFDSLREKFINGAKDSGSKITESVDADGYRRVAIERTDGTVKVITDRPKPVSGISAYFAREAETVDLLSRVQRGQYPRELYDMRVSSNEQKVVLLKTAVERFDQAGQHAAYHALRELDGDPVAQAELAHHFAIYREISRFDQTGAADRTEIANNAGAKYYIKPDDPKRQSKISDLEDQRGTIKREDLSGAMVAALNEPNTSKRHRDALDLVESFNKPEFAEGYRALKSMQGHPDAQLVLAAKLQRFQSLAAQREAVHGPLASHRTFTDLEMKSLITVHLALQEQRGNGAMRKMIQPDTLGAVLTNDYKNSSGELAKVGGYMADPRATDGMNAPQMLAALGLDFANDKTVTPYGDSTGAAFGFNKFAFYIDMPAVDASHAKIPLAPNVRKRLEEMAATDPNAKKLLALSMAADEGGSYKGTGRSGVGHRGGDEGADSMSQELKANVFEVPAGSVLHALDAKGKSQVLATYAITVNADGKKIGAWTINPALDGRLGRDVRASQIETKRAQARAKVEREFLASNKISNEDLAAAFQKHGVLSERELAALRGGKPGDMADALRSIESRLRAVGDRDANELLDQAHKSPGQLAALYAQAAALLQQRKDRQAAIAQGVSNIAIDQRNADVTPFDNQLTSRMAQRKDQTEQASDGALTQLGSKGHPQHPETDGLTPSPSNRQKLHPKEADGLIGLPNNVIPANSTAADALLAMQHDGIPRMEGLNGFERKHERAFADEAERNLPKLVDDFYTMSFDAKVGTHIFEVDGAKKLYGEYGQDKKGANAAEREVRVMANHALHPTAVAITRLAFLKRLDELAALPKDSPLRAIFVTNGGCAAGKGNLSGLVKDVQGGFNFGAVWDAAGEGYALENSWILAAAQKRGLKVTYGIAENDPMKKYNDVLARADATDRIVDPLTFTNSYVQGQENFRDFLRSPAYLKASQEGQASAIGVFTGRFDPASLKNKENGTDIPEYPEKRLLGDKGKIGADDLAQMPSQQDVMAESLRVFEAWKKQRIAEGKPTELYQQGGIDNMAKFGTKTATGDTSRGVTASNVVSIQPTTERAAENRADAQKAAATQKRKAAQLAALLKDKAARKEIIETDVIIAGAGQSGIMDYATHKATAGTTPSDNVTSVPSIFVIAPEGSMFAAHGETRIGQKPGELATPALTRQVGDFTDQHNQFAKACDVTDALTSTANDKGMMQFHASVKKVEHNPNDGSWPSTKKLRVTAGGVEIYCNQFDSALGLGAPVPLGTRMKGARLNTVDATGVTGESRLETAGLLVHAQLSLVLPNSEAKKRIAVVGDGPSGAWAVLRALETGVEHVYWYGNSDYVRQAPDALRKELTRLNMTPAQINVFFGAFNIRNKGAFTDTTGRIHFVDGFKDAEVNSANNREVVIHSKGGPLVVDGVVSAVGSSVQMPTGAADKGTLRPVVKLLNGHYRVVALEGVGSDGKPNGIRLVGAQIYGSGVEALIVPEKLQMYRAFKKRQADDPNAPTNSRGVLGSLHTTAENAQLMND